MPDTPTDLAARLESALDDDSIAHHTDPLAPLLALATELHDALHNHPALTEADRTRIHARAVALAQATQSTGFRRPWPQLATHLSTHPAVVGGAAAAVLAAAVLAALRDRRAHTGGNSASRTIRPILDAA